MAIFFGFYFIKFFNASTTPTLPQIRHVEMSKMLHFCEHVCPYAALQWQRIE